MKKSIKWILIAGIAIVILAIAFSVGTNDETVSVGGADSDIEIVSYSGTYDDEMDVYTVYVEVKNNSSKLLSGGTLKVVFKDAQGKIVGTGDGVMLNIPAGQTKTVECLAADVQAAHSYTIQTEALLFE